MPSNAADASSLAGGYQMILTDLTRPIPFSCFRISEHPFRINDWLYGIPVPHSLHTAYTTYVPLTVSDK